MARGEDGAAPFHILLHVFQDHLLHQGQNKGEGHQACSRHRQGEGLAGAITRPIWKVLAKRQHNDLENQIAGLSASAQIIQCTEMMTLTRRL